MVAANGARGEWHESMQGILYVVEDEVQFADDWHHWRNAFLRLLEIEDERARHYVEQTVACARERHGILFSRLPSEHRIDCLKQATVESLNRAPWRTPPEPLPSWGVDLKGAHADKVYAQSVSGDRTRFVAGNREHEFAWLIDASSMKPVAADTIVYDAAYFSTGRGAHYGQKGYLADSDWRMEKAHRLVRNIMSHAGARKGSWMERSDDVKVLDVGSAAGYFRRAFADYGFQHFGIDLSEEMIVRSKEIFGFDTWKGEISKLDELSMAMRFDIITLWDVIEHLDNVAGKIEILRDHLTDDGILVVRTPNLSALEAEVLVDYYYSFKMDHVIYFSPRSLHDLMNGLALVPLHLETDSHIFKGLLGADCLFKLGKELRGADIFAMYEKAR